MMGSSKKMKWWAQARKWNDGLKQENEMMGHKGPAEDYGSFHEQKLSTFNFQLLIIIIIVVIMSKNHT